MELSRLKWKAVMSTVPFDVMEGREDVWPGLNRINPKLVKGLVFAPDYKIRHGSRRDRFTGNPG